MFVIDNAYTHQMIIEVSSKRHDQSMEFESGFHSTCSIYIGDTMISVFLFTVYVNHWTNLEYNIVFRIN